MNKASLRQKKYDDSHMVHYSLKYNKNLHEFVEKAVNDAQVSRNKWVVTAITEKLQRDGYLSDNLPNNSDISQ